ncbi:beta-ketoacyl-ACP synthase II [Pseudoramibacter alactolyticus]
MNQRRVVITGMGTVNPLGNDTAASWAAAKAGQNGIAPITQFDAGDLKVQIAGEVKDLDISPVISRKDARHMDRFTQFARVAAHEAMTAAGLDMAREADPTRCGVIFSSGIGGIGTIADSQDRGRDKGFDRVSPFFVPSSIANMAAGQIAIAYGFQGYSTCVVTACASSNNAIGDAFRQIRDGYADVMMAGGAEASVTPLCIGGFTSMKALCTTNDPDRASTPFDADRSGFVMGEGAGALILESLEHAEARGAAILGEVVGYGTSTDAYHITAPQPEGRGAIVAMQKALSDAGIAPDAIDYINAHGTSTSMNDAIETKAVKGVFGDHAKALAISSTKSMTGHLLGATGAIEAIFTLCALRDGFIPPTIGYRTPDPECDLDIVPNEGRAADLRYALSNGLGFGGHNAVVVMKKWGD